MIEKVGPPGAVREPELDKAFTLRIDLALDDADQRKRRLAWRRRMVRVIPLLLLAAPIAAWRLMMTTPDGVHVVVDALAWLTFVLDVGVQVDASLLRYLGLEALPTIVGILLLIVITMWVLYAPRSER